MEDSLLQISLEENGVKNFSTFFSSKFMLFVNFHPKILHFNPMSGNSLLSLLHPWTVFLTNEMNSKLFAELVTFTLVGKLLFHERV